MYIESLSIFSFLIQLCLVKHINLKLLAIRRITPFGEVARDPAFWGMLVLGIPAVLYKPAVAAPTFTILLLKVIAEEMLFRGVIQDYLEQKIPACFFVFSAGNIITSLLFSAAHLLSQPFWWAASTCLPSLVIGVLWSRHKSVVACSVLHLFYNVMFFTG